MSRLPTIVPVSDLRQDASKVLDIVRAEKGPLIITQHGRAAAVLLSVPEYQEVERQLQLLALLTQGEKEIARADGERIETVMAAARSLLGR